MEASRVVVGKYRLFWDDPLLKGALMLTKRDCPYKIAVVDRSMRVKGTLTGRRVLEVILGERGTSLMEKEGLGGVLKERIGLFIDEAFHMFTLHTPLSAILQYMVENGVGQVLVVDRREVLKGIVSDASILHRARLVGETKVEDVMVRDVKTVGFKDPLSQAIAIMTSFRVRRLPVIDKGRITGLITIRDILRYIKREGCLTEGCGLRRVMSVTVSRVMRKRPITIGPDETLRSAVKKVKRHDISTLPVTDEGVLVGLLTRFDILKGLVLEKGAGELVKLLK